MVQGALNGSRTKAEHPAVPYSAAELAVDAARAHRAGALAVHLHPRAQDGRQSLAAAVCDAAVSAIRWAVPGLPIGLSTAAAIDPSVESRCAEIVRWTRAPDLVSINLWEDGWEELARAALRAGIGIEAGLSSVHDAEEFARSPLAGTAVRALVEVEGPAEAAAIAAAVPPAVSQLWHGEGLGTWDVLALAARDGRDVRVGLEDVLTLPDGSRARDNAALVSAAVAVVGQAPRSAAR